MPNAMKKKILIVEDEKLSRAIIVATLESNGICCVSAEHGQQALDLLNNQPFDLILTDLRMPVLNGLELIKVIREHEKTIGVTRGVPIVVLSAEKGEMIDAAVELGISDYFIKSAPVDSLVPKLKQLLGDIPKAQ